LKSRIPKYEATILVLLLVEELEGDLLRREALNQHCWRHHVPQIPQLSLSTSTNAKRKTPGNNTRKLNEETREVNVQTRKI
jgi:hypothetical protein